LLLRRRKCDVVVALGVIVRGGTLHYELVAQAATDGLLRVSLDAGVPVITGVVVAENLAQAEERCLGKIDRGAEFAQAALEMAALRKRLSS
jgi:6,7-dimethyl-8-ribityllumazine synthase